jgi:hypothetical protein
MIELFRLRQGVFVVLWAWSLVLITAGLPHSVRAEGSPMTVEIFPLEDDEPEAALPEPGTPVPAGPATDAPIPPRRPGSPFAHARGAAPEGGTGHAPAASPQGAGGALAARSATSSLIEAPLPPRRPFDAILAPRGEGTGAEAPAPPLPVTPAPVAPAEAASERAAPAAPAPRAEPGQEIVVDDRPNLVVAFAPPIAEETTTEEIEAEEARAPEPTIVEKQTDAVDIACIRPEVMGLVRSAGAYFAETPVITSGQRNRGRRGSLHRRCMAADFFIPGVERARLARFLRALPGAGGVGTYCHTKSVHIDIGDRRNWYQCGRRFRFAQR